MRRKLSVCQLLFCFILVPFSVCGAGDIVEWTGGAGDMNWYSSGNWEIPFPPGSNKTPEADDLAFIESGRIFIGPNGAPAGVVSLSIGSSLFGGTGSATVNLIGGSLLTSSGITLTDYMGDGTLNIIDGELNTFAVGQDYGGPGNNGSFNIIGSGSDIAMTWMSYSNNAPVGFRQMATNFYFDTGGISTIHVNGDADNSYDAMAGLAGNHLISAYGFTLQSLSGRYDLIEIAAGGQFGDAFLTDSPFTVSTDATTVSVQFDDTKLDRWNIATSIAFSGEEQLDGWLKIIKGSTAPEVIHGSLTGVSDEIAPVLSEFLSAGMGGLSILVTPGDDGYYAVLPTGSLVDGEIFGWGLSAFNAVYGTDVRLTGFDGPQPIPEPSTCFLLGTAVVGLLWYRKRGVPK